MFFFYFVFILVMLLSSMTLEIEVTCSSEISDDYQRNTKRYTSEDLNLHNVHLCSLVLADTFCLSILALLAAWFLLLSCLIYSSTLQIEVTYPLKLLLSFKGLHGFISQKIEIFVSVFNKLIAVIRV
jgi:hypothetical protein